jgi:hypothetical protein
MSSVAVTEKGKVFKFISIEKQKKVGFHVFVKIVRFMSKTFASKYSIMVGLEEILFFARKNVHLFKF